MLPKPSRAYTGKCVSTFACTQTHTWIQFNTKDDQKQGQQDVWRLVMKNDMKRSYGPKNSIWAFNLHLWRPISSLVTQTSPLMLYFCISASALVCLFSVIWLRRFVFFKCLFLIIAALLQNPTCNTAVKLRSRKFGNNILWKMKNWMKEKKIPADWSHELSSVKYLWRQTVGLSLFMWFWHLSRRSTGEEASRKWPPQTFTTANCGRHLATGSTTATTCSPSPWKKISLHSSPWTAPGTGTNPQRSFVSSVSVSPTYTIQLPSRHGGVTCPLSAPPAAWCSATGLARGGSSLWGWPTSASCTGTSCRGRWPVWPECGASSRTTLTSSAGWIRWWHQ